MAIDDADREHLTDAEIEALEEDYDEGGEQAAGADETEGAEQTAGAEQAEEQTDQGAEADEEQATGEADKGEQAKEDQAEGAQAADQPDTETPAQDTAQEQRPFVPQLNTDETQDYGEQLQTLDTQAEQLLKQFNDGDLDESNYHKQLFELQRQREAVVREQTKAELRSDFNQELQQRHWEWEQAEFFRRQANQIYEQQPLLYESLNAAVKQIAAQDDYQQASGLQILEEADRRVRELFTLGGGQQQAQQPEQQQQAQDKPPAGKKFVADAAPKTLTDVPSADTPEIGDEFAHLDRLTGMEFEDALAKLPPEQQEKYLNVRH